RRSGERGWSRMEFWSFEPIGRIRCPSSCKPIPRTRATMQRFLYSILLSFFVASTVTAQTRTIAERLGHPRDAKLLILHADDIGVAHSEDSASFDALDKGAVNSASVMMPTPWVTEVAQY